MKRVEVLSIGTELLMGQIANTNAQYISKRMPELGMGVFYHSVVGDNPLRLKECLRIALERSDIIITTGGLGPTQDDLTKSTIAEYFGLKMVLHKPSEERIKEYFAKSNRMMSSNNLQQAYFPENAIVLQNDWGTAPACIINVSDKIIIMLPGPPSELQPIFQYRVLPELKRISDRPLESKFLRVVGIGESMIESKLIDLIDKQNNPTIATYAKDGIVTIRVTAHDEDGKSATQLIDNTCGNICDILGDNVYSLEDEELECKVIKLLKEKGLMFSCVESCTGGMLAQKITAVPGASKVFMGSIVTYTNEAKMALVNVRKDTLDEFSAVSSQTAMEMVEGVSNVTKSDVSISITGYAGPADEFGKDPVGLVYIGIKTHDICRVQEFRFTGSRERIRTLCVVNALDMVRRSI